MWLLAPSTVDSNAQHAFIRVDVKRTPARSASTGEGGAAFAIRFRGSAIGFRYGADRMRALPWMCCSVSAGRFSFGGKRNKPRGLFGLGRFTVPASGSLQMVLKLDFQLLFASDASVSSLSILSVLLKPLPLLSRRIACKTRSFLAMLVNDLASLTRSE